MNSHNVNESQKPGVYRIPCECGLVYIGETGRNLSVRLKEHKTNCEKAEQDKSAVAKHTWTYDHRIKWDEATILAIDSHKFSRKMRESIEIEKHNTIDQEGKPLDSTWRALFNHRIDPDQKGHSYVFWLKENVRNFFTCYDAILECTRHFVPMFSCEKLPCALQDGIII